MSRSLGFELAEIAVPVGVWHGSLDRTIVEESSRYYADTIPDVQLTIHQDVGHLSLAVDYGDEILTWLTSR